MAKFECLGKPSERLASGASCYVQYECCSSVATDLMFRLSKKRAYLHELRLLVYYDSGFIQMQ